MLYDRMLLLPIISYFYFTSSRVQVNVFLNRLNGKPIGFSVLGIFVIDKNTILTVNVHCL